MLVALTVPINSGLTVPVKSPASSAALGMIATLVFGFEYLQPS
jgi:hypothetical protein